MIQQQQAQQQAQLQAAQAAHMQSQNQPAQPSLPQQQPQMSGQTQAAASGPTAPVGGEPLPASVQSLFAAHAAATKPAPAASATSGVTATASAAVQVPASSPPGAQGKLSYSRAVDPQAKATASTPNGTNANQPPLPPDANRIQQLQQQQREAQQRAVHGASNMTANARQPFRRPLPQFTPGM